MNTETDNVSNLKTFLQGDSKDLPPPKIKGLKKKIYKKLTEKDCDQIFKNLTPKFKQ